ncbi:unnamed protein product [Victoria cruziana]
MMFSMGILGIKFISPNNVFQFVSGFQPIFIGASVAPTVAYPPPPIIVPVATSRWPSVTRPPPPRMLVPGTGVFLPPARHGHSPPHQQGGATLGESSSPAESASEIQPQNEQLSEKNNTNRTQTYRRM